MKTNDPYFVNYRDDPDETPFSNNAALLKYRIEEQCVHAHVIFLAGCVTDVCVVFTSSVRGW